MTRSVRFIHAADLHLGAPVRGLHDVGSEWAARLGRSIAEAYGRVIEAALSKSVDFVVFAGDAFDAARPSYGDYLRFFEGLERLDAAGIAAYLVTGNHDPYTIWAQDVGRLPKSAHMLGANGPEFALHCRDDEPLCLIGGRSYYTQSWPRDESVAAGLTRAAAEKALSVTDPSAPEAPFSVGVIHTGLDIDTEKAPVDVSELLGSGIDYWACGHLHRSLVLPSSHDPRVVFSGCVQGRDIKETDERGCYLVELEELEKRETAKSESSPTPSNRARLEFIPTSSVVFQQVKVDVGACQTLADVARLVQAHLFRENSKTHCDEMIVRVELTGETDLHGFLVRRDIINDLRKHINNAYPSFFCDALVDRTRPRDALSREVEGSGLFASIVADMADEQRDREDVLINYVQSEFVKRGIAIPSALSRRVGDFNDEAEALLLGLLQEEAE